MLKIGLQDIRNAWYWLIKPRFNSLLLFTREHYISGFLEQEEG